MVEHKGMVIPKSHKNTEKVIFNMSFAWLICTGIFALISGVIAMLALFSSGMIRSFFIVIVLLIWSLYLAKFRDDNHLEHTKLLYFYYIRKRNRDTEINKYDLDQIELLKMFMLGIRIFPKGLIQTADGLYFLLLKYTPSRMSNDMREAFFNNTIALLNSLPTGISFMFYIVTRNTRENRYEKKILEAAANPLADTNSKKHLHSIHKLITDNPENIEWDFTMEFGLGKFETPEEAEFSRQSLLTGLTDQLAVVETDSHVIESPQEITYLIYQSICQLREVSS